MKSINDMMSRSMADAVNDVYHKTRLLLHIYRDAVWRMEEDIIDIHDAACSLGGDRIKSLCDFLSLDIGEYRNGTDKRRLEERLTSIAESKEIIDIIDKSLAKLRNYPGYGEIYFQILYGCHISRQRLSHKQIMDRLHISPSTYFRYKRQATEKLGTILWGLVRPELSGLWDPTDCKQAAERYD
ncbi:MAG TPA: hypothetical protein PK830_00205 [Candidatus Atribacteria bacterium]|nr:hypothetical protein [Candidatus Atribacteria bacterium]HPT77518.1 hypothetical protein [Candidatus Atribacteria bacterium]